MALSEEYYKSLLDKLFDGILCVDKTKTVTFWNKSAEKISGYAASEVIGRVICDEILTHTDRNGNSLCKECLIDQCLEDGQTKEGEYSIVHKEGHRVPIACRIEPIHEERGGISGAVQIFHDNTSRVAARSVIEKLRKLALIDPLTGLANRRYLEKVLESKTEEMKRYGLAFGLLFIDIDHFKEVNDQYGHDMGDKVLWAVARNMSTVVRSSDIVGRWGGEEFIGVILNVNSEQLQVVAEKIRSGIEETKVE